MYNDSILHVCDNIMVTFCCVLWNYMNILRYTLWFGMDKNGYTVNRNIRMACGQ